MYSPQVNGQEAIGVFSSTQIDLVLTDLGLPQMDGNALIGHLKEISPEVPMILTSDTVRAGERAHRADAFLAKGCCTPAELIERIRVIERAQARTAEGLGPGRHARCRHDHGRYRILIARADLAAVDSAMAGIAVIEIGLSKLLLSKLPLSR